MKEGFNKSILFNVTHSKGSQKVTFFKSNLHFKKCWHNKKIAEKANIKNRQIYFCFVTFIQNTRAKVLDLRFWLISLFREKP